jgi:hypothetical protein
MIFASMVRRAGALELSVSERSIAGAHCIKLHASCIKMQALSMTHSAAT